MVSCNTTLADEKVVEHPLFGKVQFHHLGLVVSAIFGLTAIVIAIFLITRHATHYSKPWQQKHIIRILFMIPIYAMVSFLSYLYYQHAVYYEVIRDCYEAFAIASFFALLCNYIAENLHEQKEYFRSIEPKNWLWPLTWVQKCTGGRERGLFRVPRSGLTWFNIIWIGVFQYCFIRVLFTIVSVLAQATDRYCEASLSPAFAHIWTMVFEGVAVTVAMYCLIQFYYQLRHDLAQHSPFLKILCIKLVIFFSFWQSLLISFLTSSGAIKTSKTLAYPDIKIGIPSMLLCIEMALFAVMHLFAFSWKEYVIPETGESFGGVNGRYKGGRLGMSALADAFNPWDIIKASARGFRWLFVGVRKREQDRSYQTSTKLTQLDSGNQPYHGPTFAGNGEPAVEAGNSHRYDSPPKLTPYGSVEDDRAGLLSHAQANPYQQLTAEPNPFDGDKLPSNPTPASAMTDRPPRFEEEEAEFSKHPQRNEPRWSQQQPYLAAAGEWNVFGGASSSNPPSARPER